MKTEVQLFVEETGASENIPMKALRGRRGNLNPNEECFTVADKYDGMTPKIRWINVVKHWIYWSEEEKFDTKRIKTLRWKESTLSGVKVFKVLPRNSRN